MEFVMNFKLYQPYIWKKFFGSSSISVQKAIQIRPSLFLNDSRGMQMISRKILFYIQIVYSIVDGRGFQRNSNCTSLLTMDSIYCNS